MKYWLILIFLVSSVAFFAGDTRGDYGKSNWPKRVENHAYRKAICEGVEINGKYGKYDKWNSTCIREESSETVEKKAVEETKKVIYQNFITILIDTSQSMNMHSIDLIGSIKKSIDSMIPSFSNTDVLKIVTFSDQEDPKNIFKTVNGYIRMKKRTRDVYLQSNTSERILITYGSTNLSGAVAKILTTYSHEKEYYDKKIVRPYFILLTDGGDNAPNKKKKRLKIAEYLNALKSIREQDGLPALTVVPIRLDSPMQPIGDSYMRDLCVLLSGKKCEIIKLTEDDSLNTTNLAKTIWQSRWGRGDHNYSL